MWSICFGRFGFVWQRVTALSIAVLLLSAPLHASVATVGNVTPVPPVGGGAVAGPFTIGNTSLGSVIVNGGTAITNTSAAILGDGANGIGGVTLDGFGSNWSLVSGGADLTIADAGIGSLFVTNNAVLNVNDDTFLGVSANSMGRGRVTDLGSVWNNGDDMTIGGSGLGIMEVLNGGQLISDAANVGANATGEGRVTVAGDLSRWQLAGSTIGSSGFGSVTVSDAGRIFSSSSVTLANSASSRAEVLVDGTSSQWNISGSMSSNSGDAQVTISNGGRITTSNPSTISTTGRVKLEGGRWDYSSNDTNAISLFGLLEGSGTLDMPGVSMGLSGGVRGRLHTSTGDHLLLTGLLANTGVVDLDGGELEIRGTMANNFSTTARNGAVLRVGSTGLTNNGNAQISITGGTVDVFGTVNNLVNAEIAVVGGATGVFHDAVTNNGTIFVSPGSEIVMLQDLNFSASSALNITLADAAETQPTDGFGQATTPGAATLAGTLNVSLAAGYAPSLGDSFQILSAGSGRSGMFTTENLPTLTTGLNWDTEYSSNALTLQVIAASLPGDFDFDGDVDGRDFLVWQRNTSVGNLSDWQANYGTPLTAAATAVPEPNVLVLLLCSIVFLPAVRRSRAGVSRI
ncbi:hypothetical protein [Bythopirellula polymerisocia]|uniref:Lipoprotein n=1 Tax=Bythopirellula polymerisocia TaxID=2528003 RepID=A0A5C6D4Z5_9BACT|nr:hypothetical protein [Bythopirellula polymerisocia]TWU29949.1 hypothetical protein Pla144_07300 [Bythopirellula polymerisocia]